jgi:uncharacterized integral membrane protein
VPDTPPSPPASGPPPLKVPDTRTSRTWVGVGIGLFLLLLVAIFVGQNIHDTRLNFLWLHGTVTVGVAILVAFAVGGLCVVLIGTARLTQLRVAARRYRRDEAKRG